MAEIYIPDILYGTVADSIRCFNVDYPELFPCLLLGCTLGGVPNIYYGNILHFVVIFAIEVSQTVSHFSGYLLW